MSKIYFVRHGETAWNADSRLQGQLDIELSEFGKTQADYLAERFREINSKVDNIDGIFTSNLLRAKETAQIISNSINIDAFEDKALAEIYLGQWQGKLVSEVKAEESAQYEVFRNRPAEFVSKEMETLTDIGERFCSFINRCIIGKPGDKIIVSHGTIMRAGMARLIFGDVKYMNNLVFENASITEVDFHEYNGVITPVIYTLNNTDHLKELNKDRKSSKILMGVI